MRAVVWHSVISEEFLCAVLVFAPRQANCLEGNRLEVAHESKCGYYAHLNGKSSELTIYYLASEIFNDSIMLGAEQWPFLSKKEFS